VRPAAWASLAAALTLTAAGAAYGTFLAASWLYTFTDRTETR
jgi:hypothetical protein